MDIKYNITYHAIERLQQRFGAFCSEIPLLKNWKREQGITQLKSLFNDMLSFTEENKSYQNNSAYMIDLYEKYGYDTEYCFLELKEKNILFILTKARSAKEYMLVTLMPTDYRPGVKNIKYAGKEEKKLSFEKFLMNWSRQDIIANKKPLSQTIKYEVDSKANQVNNAINTENKSEIVLDESTKSLHKQLIASIRENEAIQVERVSNSKCIYVTTLNTTEYEFTYSKTNSGVKTVEINHITNLSKEQKENFDNGFREIYPKTYLYQTILKTIRNNEADFVSKTDNSSIYKVSLYNQLYNVTLCEKDTVNPKLVIRTKNNTNIMVKVKADHEELKNSGIALEKNQDLYIRLLKEVNDENFRLIEKYSVTTSLRVTTLDNVDYQYVYIKRNNKEKDREIILQNHEQVANHTLYKNDSSHVENKKNIKVRI